MTHISAYEASYSSDTTRTVPVIMDRARTVLILAIGYQIALLIPSLIAYVADIRLLDGASVWSKPIKFELSLAMTIGTVVLLLPLLTAEDRQSRAVRWSAVVIALSSSLEISYLVLQAARGRASHFNVSTVVENVAYAFMGIGAVSIVVGCFIIGLVIARRGRTDLGPGLRLGAATGLMLGAVLTLITAGLMSSAVLTQPGHWVGGIRSDAHGLFLFGWSTTGGDLRVPHFFATHLMQGLPLLGLLLDRLSPAASRSGVWIGAGLGVAIVAATFVQAVMGLPFLSVLGR